jgi:membrane associated rhomboid family serine protease
MGIYDRDYYREPSPRWVADLGNSGTVWIMATTIVLFFVQAFSRPPLVSPLAEWGQFHFGKISEGEVWRIFTAGLIPDGWLFGLILSMILLFWAGKELERVYGTRTFVAFYILAGLATSLGKFALGLAGIDVDVSSMGIGGAIFAVMVLFACLEPKRTVLVMFVLPMPIALLVAILLALAVLSALNGGTKVHAVGMISGAVFGFAFFKVAPGVLNWLRANRQERRTRSPVRLHVSPVDENEPERRPTESERSHPPPAAMPRPARVVDEQLEAKLDQVLSKVAKQGRASLTSEENEILQRASEIYKKKRS